jgi:hypothetical protein
MRKSQSEERQALDRKWLSGEISDADYIVASQELDKREGEQ